MESPPDHCDRHGPDFVRTGDGHRKLENLIAILRGKLFAVHKQRGAVDVASSYRPLSVNQVALAISDIPPEREQLYCLQNQNLAFSRKQRNFIIF